MSNIAVSLQGYGHEGAFDHRAEQTGFTVLKPYTGQEFLNLLTHISKNSGPIQNMKIFGHSYERGLIMTNWSGFYDEPGPDDTKRAAYISDLGARINQGDIKFMTNSQISMFGCNLAGIFSEKLSATTGGTVIAPAGKSYPEIYGNRETGVFFATSHWSVYKNGVYVYSLGKRHRAW